MNVVSSLRLRIAFGLALLAVLTVGIYSIVLYSAAEEQEDGLMDRIVDEELDHLIEQYRNNPAVVPTRSQFLNTYIVHGGDGRTVLPVYLRELPVGFHEIPIDDTDLHVGVRTYENMRFYVVYDVTYNEERLRKFGWWLVFGVFATAVVSSALGYWTAGLLVQPVNELAYRVEHLGPDRPVTPLAQEYADQEVRRLASAFDGYLVKVASFIQREQEFTANVSHELRTPLTAIRTGCELLLQEPRLTDLMRQRIETIDRAAARLTETARSLLFLARGDEPSMLEEISIQECVTEAAEPMLAVLARKGIAFENTVDPAAVLRADRAALFLVVDNLLRNAVSYTERGFVRIGYRDGCLLIEDTGPGIEAAKLSRIGERFYRGGRPPTANDGLGLGLAIVNRICERFGWRLEVASTTGSGTRAGVHFPLPASQYLHTVLTSF